MTLAKLHEALQEPTEAAEQYKLAAQIYATI